MELQAQFEEDCILLGRGACRAQRYLSTVSGRSGRRGRAGCERMDSCREARPIGLPLSLQGVLSSGGRGRGHPPQQKRWSRKGVPFRDDGLEANPGLPPRTQLPAAHPPVACAPSRARWGGVQKHCLIRWRQAGALGRLGLLVL